MLVEGRETVLKEKNRVREREKERKGQNVSKANILFLGD